MLSNLNASNAYRHHIVGIISHHHESNERESERAGERVSLNFFCSFECVAAASAAVAAFVSVMSSQHAAASSDLNDGNKLI